MSTPQQKKTGWRHFIKIPFFCHHIKIKVKVGVKLIATITDRQKWRVWSATIRSLRELMRYCLSPTSSRWRLASYLIRLVTCFGNQWIKFDTHSAAWQFVESTKNGFHKVVPCIRVSSHYFTEVLMRNQDVLISCILFVQYFYLKRLIIQLPSPFLLFETSMSMHILLFIDWYCFFGLQFNFAKNCFRSKVNGIWCSLLDKTISKIKEHFIWRAIYN